MKTKKTILALLLVQIFCLFVPQSIFCQTETLDIMKFTPPAGWTRTEKDGALVFIGVNKTTNGFCVLSFYGSIPSSGRPDTDFTNQWKTLAVNTFKAQPNPKTESSTNSDGWQVIIGASEIESEGGKMIALLTVFSGFGKTASVLTVVNDETLLARVDTVINGIKLDKIEPRPISNRTKSTSTNQIGDPFPDIPGYAPQKPLAGTLKGSISMEDLAGTWNNEGVSVETYVNSTTGNYAGTDITAHGEGYLIKPDGSFSHKFVAITGNGQVKETNSGTVILAGDTITFKLNNGKTPMRYQLIGYMTLPNGGAVLSMIALAPNENEYGAERLRQMCGHTTGIIHCTEGEEWMRIKPGN
jgi:hypothetical protein